MACSYFERTFYEELISMSCVGAYLESWVKLLGLLISKEKGVCFTIALYNKLGYVHGPAYHGT